MFKTSKHSSIPLHVQLLNELRRAILSKELKPHDRLPGEYELVDQLNISRSTVQRAWRTAQEEGLIYRVAAKGTYVAEPPDIQPTIKNVGCIVPEFRYTFDGNLLDGAEKTLRAAGYRLLFAQSERRVEEENRLVRSMCAEEGVVGILLWPVGAYPDGSFVAERDCPVPLVLIDRPIPGMALPCVASRNYNGGLQAMNHLLQLGHQQIAFAAWPPLDLWPVAERLKAYHDAMENARLPALPVIELGDADEAANYKRYYSRNNEGLVLSVERLNKPDRPTAVFAMNDLVALLVLRAANQAGLHVPDDLSVVGFDNLELTEQVVPALTTVAQNSRLMGAEAARRLLVLIDGEPPQDIFTLLPTRLIVRKSTAPYRNRTDNGPSAQQITRKELRMD